MQYFNVKKYLLLILIGIATQLNLVGQSNFEVTLDIPKEVGYLEQLILHVKLSYKGNKNIEITEPFSNGMKLYLGRSSEDTLYRAEIDQTSFMLHNPEGDLVPLSSLQMMPGYSVSSFFMVYPPSNLRDNNAEKTYERFLLQPGQYEIKLVYTPFSNRKKILKKDKPIIIQKKVEIVDYSQSKEQKAVDWLLRRQNPLILYYPRLFHTNKKQYSKTISELEAFVNTFPDSRFTPFGYFNISLLLRIKATTEDHSTEDYLKMYERIISNYNKFVEKSIPESTIYEKRFRESLYEDALMKSRYYKSILGND